MKIVREQINLEEKLLSKGYILLESSTRTYTNGKETGSICRINHNGTKGKILRLITDDDYDKFEDEFVLFKDFLYIEEPLKLLK